MANLNVIKDLLKQQAKKNILTNFLDYKYYNCAFLDYSYLVKNDFEEKKAHKYLNFLDNKCKVIAEKKYQIKIDSIFKCDIPSISPQIFFFLNSEFYNEVDNVDYLNSLNYVYKLKSIKEILAYDHYFKDLEEKNFFNKVVNVLFHNAYKVLINNDTNKIREPIQLVNLFYYEEPLHTYSKFIIEISEGTNVSIIFCAHTLNSNKYIVGLSLDIILKPNSKLYLYQMSNINDSSLYFINNNIYQEKNSEVNIFSTAINSATFFNTMNVYVKGENAITNLYGLWHSVKDQDVNYYTSVKHMASYTISNQLFKGIMDGKATGLYKGLILIEKNLKEVEAKQKNQNLLLSKESKIISLPFLRTYSDKVKCFHGSATGYIDQEALFYLCSRGIPKKEACFLLTEAFANEIINEIKISSLKEFLANLISKKLRGELQNCFKCEDCVSNL